MNALEGSAIVVGMEDDGSVSAPQPVFSREVFSVGAALSRSFAIWGRNLPFFVGLTLAVHLPLLLIPSSRDPTLRTVGYLYLTIVLQALLNFVVTGALTYAVVEQLRGRTVEPRRTLAVGLSKFGPLLGVSLVTGLMVGLATLACCVPGVILWLRWMLVAPIVVVEGGSGTSVRARSEFLTRGHRGGLFGMFLMIGLGSALLGGLFGVLLARGDMFLYTLTVNVVLTSIIASFTAVLYGVTYYLLRSEKEGVDIEQLASVFG